MKRTAITLVLASVLIFQLACDSLLTSFKVGFAASKPFVQSLATSGALTQGKADIVVRDISDGVAAADRGDGCIKAITVSGPAKRVAKAKCYLAVATDLRGILARHNISGDARLDQIATIAAGAIEAFEAYYTAVNTGPAVTGPDGGITHTGADGIDGSDADKQLESTLKSLNQQLKDLSKQ